LLNKDPPASPSVFGAAIPLNLFNNNPSLKAPPATSSNPSTNIFGGSSQPTISSNASTNIFGKVNPLVSGDKKAEDKSENA
jgi:hypothetical protein